MMIMPFLLCFIFAGQLLFADGNLLQNAGFEKETNEPPRGVCLNFAKPWLIYLNSGESYGAARLSEDCVEGKKSLELEVIADGGKKSGILLNKAFPGITWSYVADKMTWESDNMKGLRTEPCNNGYAAEANIGTGKVFLFNSMADLDADKFNEVMDKTTPRTVSWTAEDDKIKPVFRSDGKQWYVYITNFDLRRPRKTTIISIAKSFNNAADIGGYIPVAVPLVRDKGGVHFTVSLAPAETTIIALGERELLPILRNMRDILLNLTYS